MTRFLFHRTGVADAIDGESALTIDAAIATAKRLSTKLGTTIRCVGVDGSTRVVRGVAREGRWRFAIACVGCKGTGHVETATIAGAIRSKPTKTTCGRCGGEGWRESEATA